MEAKEESKSARGIKGWRILNIYATIKHYNSWRFPLCCLFIAHYHRKRGTASTRTKNSAAGIRNWSRKWIMQQEMNMLTSSFWWTGLLIELRYSFIFKFRLTALFTFYSHSSVIFPTCQSNAKVFQTNGSFPKALVYSRLIFWIFSFFRFSFFPQAMYCGSMTKRCGLHQLQIKSIRTSSTVYGENVWIQTLLFLNLLIFLVIFFSSVGYAKIKLIKNTLI